MIRAGQAVYPVKPRACLRRGNLCLLLYFLLAGLLGQWRNRSGTAGILELEITWANLLETWNFCIFRCIIFILFIIKIILFFNYLDFTVILYGFIAFLIFYQVIVSSYNLWYFYFGFCRIISCERML